MTKILMVAPELAKVAMVGGIAEYLLGLSGALLQQGHDVRVALPHYGWLEHEHELTVLRERLPVPLGMGASTVTKVWQTHLTLSREETHRLPVYVMGEHTHFATLQRAVDLYRWPNHEPWVVFNKAVAEWVNVSDWKPDVIHCHDAHAAMLPIYVRDARDKAPHQPLAQVRTVLTLHNLLNQGRGSQELVSFAGLFHGWYNPDGLEFYGSTNVLKGGILHADQVNTVSPTYAWEICHSNEQGFGLEDVLCHVRSEGRLRGILNGLDEVRWQLEGLHYNGSKEDIEILEAVKDTTREKLYKLWHWEESHQPVFMFRSRWDHQKGILLLAECMETITELARCVMVTWGTLGHTPEQVRAWHKLQDLAKRKPQQFLLNPEGLNDIEDTLAHYTLSDFVLMPSTYEPCGLVQLETQRCGVIPVVHHTGGLRDTVFEHTLPDRPSPNGFVFHHLEPEHCLAAVRRAIDAFHDPKRFNQLRQHALLQQNSWADRVQEYETLYKEALPR
ncbi:MAG: glycogen synthase [Deltaproteobacteria bacterium]|nr:MAG: glycogen synthase [Deltaproteobacteria bacterium]